mgnify:CR=1 FL=1
MRPWPLLSSALGPVISYIILDNGWGESVGTPAARDIQFDLGIWDGKATDGSTAADGDYTFTVAAVQGMALGGGCEFAMQATRRVVALESYMGLVEAGVGLIPAGGAEIPTFLSYSTEKRLTKYPDQFGKGAIEGVAGPEAANNASAAGTLVPLLTLGLPTSATAAMMRWRARALGPGRSNRTDGTLIAAPPACARSASSRARGAA